MRVWVAYLWGRRHTHAVHVSTHSFGDTAWMAWLLINSKRMCVCQLCTFSTSYHSGKVSLLPLILYSMGRSYHHYDGFTTWPVTISFTASPDHRFDASQVWNCQSAYSIQYFNSYNPVRIARLGSSCLVVWLVARNWRPCTQRYTFYYVRRPSWSPVLYRDEIESILVERGSALLLIQRRTRLLKTSRVWSVRLWELWAVASLWGYSCPTYTTLRLLGSSGIDWSRMIIDERVVLAPLSRYYRFTVVPRSAEETITS
jgi:hypothetical protein